MDIGKENRDRLFEVGKYLTTVREEKGFSLSKAAKAFGISKSYLSEIEAGLKCPSDVVIRSISEHLNLNEDDLFRRFGKIPLLAREQLELMPGLQKLLAKVRRKKISEDKQHELMEDLQRVYRDFLKGINDE